MPRKSNMSVTPDDGQLVESVRNSAHQIWQAGLGAFVMAQEEGGKLFEKLVRQGSDLQNFAQQLTDSGISSAREVAAKMTSDASKQAAGAWNLLEQEFEDRVARSMDRLGMSTNDDIRKLARRIEELSESIHAMSPTSRKSAPKTGTVKSAVRSVAKPVPRSAAKKGPIKATAKPGQKKTAKPAMSRSM